MNTVWIVLPVLIALMFQLGIELDRQAFAGVARRPAAVVAGLLGQLALLPLIVQMVITLVNGNLGAGIAVMGVFNLVRFRSIPGSAKDIGSVFLAMAIGLADGMGYVGLAALTFVIAAIALVALTALRFGQRGSGERILKITIPENLDYEGLFDDLFDQYTRVHTLVKVKTSNMGTLYELEYRVTLRSDSVPKAFLDALRCRNGNLNIVCGRETVKDAL